MDIFYRVILGLVFLRDEDVVVYYVSFLFIEFVFRSFIFCRSFFCNESRGVV